jgi:cytochrome c peroxidase
MHRARSGPGIQAFAHLTPASRTQRQIVKIGSVILILAAGWHGGHALALGDVPATGITPGAPVDAAAKPEGLKGIPVPTPSNLGEFVASKSAAIRLGKALFWDMQVGSDGKTACASCHFQAGSDSRTLNQVNPGQARMASPTTPNPSRSFQVGGPNYQFKRDDFPFHKLSNPNDQNSAVLRSINDVAGSAGVFNERLVAVTAGASADTRNPAGDTLFQVGGVQTRQVTSRNTPTNINAIFNFRNFYDGRAQYLFNGVNPFGARDEKARVYKLVSQTVEPVQVRIDNASMASQASGPPLSTVEMTADGRRFMDIGRRLLPARPLALQRVRSGDSVLGASVHSSRMGLKDADYASLVKRAFRSEWWNGSQVVQIDAAGKRSIVARPATLRSNQYTQMEANFSLFFGLALQMYQATLVSDDSPFDRFMAGDASAMTRTQALGMGVFFGKGQCANCHGGAEFTNASVRKTLKEPLQRMVMGDGRTAVYDEGFYNSAVRKTLDDIANGAMDPFGRPISNTGLAQAVGSSEFKRLLGISPNITVSKSERIAVNGAFKTPTLRNVELTAPYFANGGSLTLRETVEFYNRGGNFAQNNRADLDGDIKPLGLNEDEKTWLVDFMTALTDERVRYQRAPFDHPQLFINNGHTGNDRSVLNAGNGLAKDETIELPAVNAAGVDKPPANFLDGPNQNLALGKATAQSSEYAGSRSGRAVDGNTSGDWSAASITHTNYEAQPWWQVDLGSVRDLSGVELWNRTDCCASRLSNFHVLVSSTDMTGKTLAQLLADPKVGKHRVASLNGAVSLRLNATNVKGRHLRIQLTGNDYLSLAEVRVFGH